MKAMDMREQQEVRRTGQRKPVVYIAHPLGGGPERELNRERATRWAVWAAVHMGVSPVADWIVLSSLLDESNRSLGLACDVALLPRCDELWLVGGRISEGMAIERDTAWDAGVLVRDLTDLGDDPPGGRVALRGESLQPCVACGNDAGDHEPGCEQQSLCCEECGEPSGLRRLCSFCDCQGCVHSEREIERLRTNLREQRESHVQFADDMDRENKHLRNTLEVLAAAALAAINDEE